MRTGRGRGEEEAHRRRPGFTKVLFRVICVPGRAPRGRRPAPFAGLIVRAADPATASDIRKLAGLVGGRRRGNAFRNQRQSGGTRRRDEKTERGRPRWKFQRARRRGGSHADGKAVLVGAECAPLPCRRARGAPPEDAHVGREGAPNPLPTRASLRYGQTGPAAKE